MGRKEPRYAHSVTSESWAYGKTHNQNWEDREKELFENFLFRESEALLCCQDTRRAG